MLPTERLATDPVAVRRLQAACRAAGVRLAALSAHGNPLHPDPAIASQHDRQLRAAFEAANVLSVPVLAGAIAHVHLKDVVIHPAAGAARLA